MDSITEPNSTERRLEELSAALATLRKIGLAFGWQVERDGASLAHFFGTALRRQLAPGWWIFRDSLPVEGPFADNAEAFQRMHKKVSYSFDWAQRHEGFEIIELPPGRSEQETFERRMLGEWVPAAQPPAWAQDRSCANCGHLRKDHGAIEGETCGSCSEFIA